jgi:hypothetical protein
VRSPRSKDWSKQLQQIGHKYGEIWTPVLANSLEVWRMIYIPQSSRIKNLQNHIGYQRSQNSIRRRLQGDLSLNHIHPTAPIGSLFKYLALVIYMIMHTFSSTLQRWPEFKLFEQPDFPDLKWEISQTKPPICSSVDPTNVLTSYITFIL